MFEYIGMFAQPTASLAAHKADGVNLFVVCPEGSTKKEWRQKCRDLNTPYIDTPSLTPEEDVKDPLFLGWSLPDEPRTLRGNKVGTEVSVYRALCHSLRQISPTHMLWGTFAGMDITAAFPWYKGEKDKAYFGKDTDLDRVTDIACDWYPRNRGVQYPLELITRQLTLVSDWTNHTRRYWAVLECSDQELVSAPNRKVGGPTPEDIWNQAEQCSKFGCRGIVWFPQGIGRNFKNFDNRTQTQRDACIQVNKKFLAPRTPSEVELLRAENKVLSAEVTRLKGIMTTIKGLVS